MRAIPWRPTTVRTARQPSTVFCPVGCAAKEGRGESARCGAGMDGTTVERTTYGQYDLCSRSTSSCLRCGCLGISDVEAAPLVWGGEINAHSPTRRWHSAQCRRVASGFVGTGVDARLTLSPSTLARPGVPGVGVPSRSERTDAARSGVRTGVAGATELARDNDWVRGRSGGGAGGRIDQPNSAVMMAVSEGWGSSRVSLLSESVVESESGIAKVCNRTFVTVDSSDWTWVDVCRPRQRSAFISGRRYAPLGA